MSRAFVLGSDHSQYCTVADPMKELLDDTG